MAATQIVIPYAPRPLQLAIHSLLEAVRFVVAVCHRRFGKTVMAVNHLLKCALTCQKARGRFYYIAPTYRQGKAVAWDYLKHFAAVIPGVAINESELRIDLPNGAQVRIFGADNPDSLRGLYADGVVLDEYGLMAANAFSEVIRPLLADRQGWALFIGTPNGKNQFYDIAQTAKSGQAGWAYVEYRASQTGYVDPKELDATRAVMTQDEYDQEFECSFDASVKGAIYAREIRQAYEDGRVTNLPYEPILPVDTYWDLGVDDFMSIWFVQRAPGGEVRCIDYLEDQNKGLNYYAGELRRKPYAYGTHNAPHDIEVRELTTGRSRKEIAAELGIPFLVAPRLSMEDGIHSVRMLLPKCWFDRTKTLAGLESLKHYQWKPVTVQHPTSAPLPVHNWASHGADSFRTLAVTYFQPKVKKQDKERERDYATTHTGTYVRRFSGGQVGSGPRGGY